MRLYDYAASGNCLKVRILLGLLGREHTRIPVDIFDGETLTPEYAALNPARETPVLEVEELGVVVQSNAILWYLAEGTPFLPADDWSRAKVLQWLLFEQEYVMPGIAGPRFRMMTGRGTPEEIERRREVGVEALRRLDDQLAGFPFLAAELSIADIAVYAYTHAAGDAGLALHEHPNVCEWIGRIESIPGFVNDLVPYPPNARAGVSRSIYD